MYSISHICTSVNATLKDALEIIEKASHTGLPSGIILITDTNGVLVGTVSEGDIRRALIKHQDFSVNIGEFMQKDPIYFSDQFTIAEILERIPEELTRRGRKSRKFLNKIILVDSKKVPVRVLDYHQLWEQRVATHRHVVILGLGYVGLTLALALADCGYLITGVDVDPDKVKQLNEGHSYIHEVGLPELLRENINKNFKASTEIPDEGDVFVISVGTPVVKQSKGDKPKPILNYLNDAIEMISKKLRPGNLVILRSTVPVGTCRQYVIPRLEQLTGMRCGIDFHLSFAPERTAEGKAIKELRELPQIIGGFNQDSAEATVALFRELTKTIVRVDSLEAAEMAKLINNTFRDYVFAYANYMSQLARPFNINIVDVIKAANEGYPRDKVPYPSPGVGGPCLTKDPYIFASVVDDLGLNDMVFSPGRAINEGMHDFVTNALLEQLRSLGKDPAQCNVLICGLAFKGYPETGDVRNSSAIEIYQLLKPSVANVYGYDPVAEISDIEYYGLKSVTIPEGFKGIDAVLFLNNHRSFEKIDVFTMTRTMNEKPIIYDGWDMFREEDVLHAREAVYMGLSFVRSSVKAI